MDGSWTKEGKGGGGGKRRDTTSFFQRRNRDLFSKSRGFCCSSFRGGGRGGIVSYLDAAGVFFWVERGRRERKNGGVFGRLGDAAFLSPPPLLHLEITLFCRRNSFGMVLGEEPAHLLPKNSSSPILCTVDFIRCISGTILTAPPPPFNKKKSDSVMLKTCRTAG